MVFCVWRCLGHFPHNSHNHMQIVHLARPMARGPCSRMGKNNGEHLVGIEHVGIVGAMTNLKNSSEVDLLQDLLSG